MLKDCLLFIRRSHLAGVLHSIQQTYPLSPSQMPRFGSAPSATPHRLPPLSPGVDLP